MARNEAYIDAPPQAVWDVLADADAYADWVVGSRDIRDADADWPAAGSVFHHTVGLGPLNMRDNTRAIVSEPPRRLVMRANSRPLGAAQVEILLEPERGGTRVTMIEDPVGRTAVLRFLPVTHALIRGRNTESLRRLKRLAEGRHLAASGESLVEGSPAESGRRR